jgi:YHS domain-containing protein
VSTHSLRLAVAFAASLIPDIATAQHDAHQAGGSQASPEMAQCARAQPVIDNIIGTAMTRLESARLTNNPANLRAAVDGLDAALRDIRAQLAPCAEAGAPAGEHGGHTTPGMPQAPGAPAVEKPSPTGANPHAGHTMPAAPASQGNVSQPAPSKPTADPHAGHAMPATPAKPEAAAPPKPDASKPERPQAADPHAGHTSGQSAEKPTDPVNGLTVDPATSPKTTYQGQTYYFSSEQTRKEFLQNPAKFAKKPKG